MGHPWPSAAKLGIHAGLPTAQNRNEASRWGKKIKSQSNGEAALTPT